MALISTMDTQAFSQYVNDAPIDLQHLQEVLRNWADQPSGSDDLEGLAQMSNTLQSAFAQLGPTVQHLQPAPFHNTSNEEVVTGPVLHQSCRPEAPLRIFLSGHMDTVYGRNHRFRNCRMLPDGSMNGPGVADMKGGLLIMLETLRLLEASPWASQLGWEVLINSDEEIGSLASCDLIRACARRTHCGLVFESALPDGSLVRRRMGNGSFTASVTGRPAHTGRDFNAGRNALLALARLSLSIDALNRDFDDAIFNVGKIHGGGPLNVVPDHATGYFSIRVGSPQTMLAIHERLERLVKQHSTEGIHIDWRGAFTRPPGVDTPETRQLHALYQRSAEQLNTLPPGWRDTGGSSDGNFLHQECLPHLDGVGVRGGNIHSEEEFVILESIPERIRLNTLFILNLIQAHTQHEPVSTSPNCGVGSE